MMVDLQARVGAWHASRFPDVQMFHVALKAAEEVGEVAEAVNDVLLGFAQREGRIAEEAADVVIVLMALLERWVPGGDLLAEVERKLAVLNDPTSGHRSAVARSVV